MRSLRVLVIDNSIHFHEALSLELARRLPHGSLVERVIKAEDAQKKIALFKPTIMVLNFALASININGEKFLSFLKRLAPQVPIVAYGMLGSSQKTARLLGASAYVKRPPSGQPMSLFYEAILSTMLVLQAQYEQKITNDIGSGAIVTREIWHAGRKKPPAAPAEPEEPDSTEPLYQPRNSHINLIAIGASTGGTEALSALLTKLHPPLPGIVIVQHIPPMFSKLFAERLNSECSLTVKEAVSGDVVMPNHVYIAPGGKHMTIQPMGSRYMLECKPGPPVHSVCPSVDILFDSVAEVAGNKAIGIILTGMGRDGADGLLHMRQQGAPTIGQDAASSTVYGMPKAAFDAGAVEHQLPLSCIPHEIMKIAN